MRVVLLGTNHDKLNSGKPTGAYDIELAHPWAEFSHAGWEIVFASPSGGVIPLYGGNDSDADLQSMKRNASERILGSSRLGDINPESANAVFCAGGHGAMWDFPTEPVGMWLERLWLNGGCIGAVCHGVAALMHFLLSIGEVSCFTNEEERLAETEAEVPFLLESALADKGYIIRKRKPWSCCVTAWGKIFTGQNPASARETARKLLSIVGKAK